MAERQYILAPDVYVNESEEAREYVLATVVYINEKDEPAPPAGGDSGIIGGGVGSGAYVIGA